MIEISNCWYRISIKALVYNNEGKILLCKESNGIRDLPGGGLDRGENPIDCLKRELKEEMGLEAYEINSTPQYFITAHKPNSKTRPWIANICYETKLKNLEYTLSDECTEIKFFNLKEISQIQVYPNILELVKRIK